jgi:hypothetical protein
MMLFWGDALFFQMGGLPRIPGVSMHSRRLN